METSPFAVEDVYTELIIDVFYIFNSTVIDWTCFIFFVCVCFSRQIVEAYRPIEGDQLHPYSYVTWIIYN